MDYKFMARQSPYRLARLLAQGRVPSSQFAGVCRTAMLYGQAKVFRECFLRMLRVTHTPQKVEALLNALSVHPDAIVRREVEAMASEASATLQPLFASFLNEEEDDDDGIDEMYPTGGFEC
jgi:hypothetical protein